MSADYNNLNNEPNFIKLKNCAANMADTNVKNHKEFWNEACDLLKKFVPLGHYSSAKEIISIMEENEEFSGQLGLLHKKHKVDEMDLEKECGIYLEDVTKNMNEQKLEEMFAGFSEFFVGYTASNVCGYSIDLQ